MNLSYILTLEFAQGEAKWQMGMAHIKFHNQRSKTGASSSIVY